MKTDNYHGWKLTTEHAASSYGIPVLVAPDGTAYGKSDVLPSGSTGFMAVMLWDGLPGFPHDLCVKFRQQIEEPTP